MLRTTVWLRTHGVMVRIGVGEEPTFQLHLGQRRRHAPRYHSFCT